MTGGDNKAMELLAIVTGAQCRMSIYLIENSWQSLETRYNDGVGSFSS